MTTPLESDSRGVIAMILEEYKALRAEVQTRLTCLATLLGLLTAGLAIVVGVSNSSDTVKVGAAAVAAAVGLGYWMYQLSMMNRLSRRLLVIEASLNDLSRIAYPTATGFQPFTWQLETSSRRGALLSLLGRVGIPSGRG